MLRLASLLQLNVHRRTGGLESSAKHQGDKSPVHRRTGGLETDDNFARYST
ncbi:hypothetical protein SPWS13_0640 [Shewanella putrefaciens]|nr:hypothetical protein SPWS13_0640 [Shewanella putrefaciens]